MGAIYFIIMIDGRFEPTKRAIIKSNRVLLFLTKHLAAVYRRSSTNNVLGIRYNMI